MKHLILIALFCASNNVFAAFFHLEFSNDWEVDFYAQESPEVPNFFPFVSNFGDPEFHGAAPDLTVYENAFSRTILLQYPFPFPEESRLAFIDGYYGDLFDDYNFNILFSSRTQVFSSIAEQLEWLQGRENYFFFYHLSSDDSSGGGRTTLTAWNESSNELQYAAADQNSVAEPETTWLLISGILGFIGFSNRKSIPA